MLGITEGAMFESFSLYLTRQGRSRSTVEGYITDLRQFAGWLEDTGRRFEPASLNPETIRRYKDYMANFAAPSTLNRRLAAIRAYATFLAKQALLDGDPMEGVRAVRTQPRGPRWLQPEDREKLLRALDAVIQEARTRSERRRAARDVAAVHLLLFAGLRVGELVSLKVYDVDFSGDPPTVVVRRGKGGKHRVVPLASRAALALQQWLRRRPKAATDALFINRYRRPLAKIDVERAVARLSARAGISATPHSLRHTFARMLVESGASLDRVAALLGHESLDTTKIYLIPTIRDLYEAVEGIWPR
jgi:integrase/recombinase XerC